MFAFGERNSSRDVFWFRQSTKGRKMRFLDRLTASATLVAGSVSSYYMGNHVSALALHRFFGASCLILAAVGLVHMLFITLNLNFVFGKKLRKIMGSVLFDLMATAIWMVAAIRIEITHFMSSGGLGTAALTIALILGTISLVAASKITRLQFWLDGREAVASKRRFRREYTPRTSTSR